MSKNPKDGIFLPFRVIFIMVAVSICINIFFLLLGILVGKGDLKWEQDQMVVAEKSDAETIASELSVFEDTPTREQPVEIEEIEEKFEEEEEPEPTPIEEPKPPPQKKPREVEAPTNVELKAAANVAGFWIQVVASKDKAKAEAFRQRMAKDGYPATMVTESGYYKVQVGPYQSRNAANQEKDVVNKKYNVNGWVRAR